MASSCKGPGCNREAIARKLCSAHYRQQARGQRLRAVKPRGDTEPVVVRLQADALERLADFMRRHPELKRRSDAVEAIVVATLWR